MQPMACENKLLGPECPVQGKKSFLETSGGICGAVGQFCCSKGQPHGVTGHEDCSR